MGFARTSAEVYDCGKILNKVLTNLKNLDIREEDRTEIQKFRGYLSSEGFNLGRMIKCVVA